MHDLPQPAQFRIKSLYVRVIARKVVVAGEQLVATVSCHYSTVAVTFCLLDASKCNSRIPDLYWIKCLKNSYNLLSQFCHLVLSENNFDMVLAVFLCNLPCIGKIRRGSAKSCRN